MVYSFELIKHANIRYRESVSVLAHCELFAMLSSLGITCEILHEQMGGSQFLTFECRELLDSEISFLSGHSSIALMAEKRERFLRPLHVIPYNYLPEDLPEVLKYKGKTSVPFTRMMLNVAVSLSPPENGSPPLFFDPVCGKGTGCFCALCSGMNAVGLDTDRKDIRESIDYFSRYLKYHKLKHEQRSHSETTSKQAIPVTSFRFADTREHFHAGDTRSLVLACTDTAESPALFRKGRADIIIADLPYGVQHAPQTGIKPEPLTLFLSRVLPAWKQSLRQNGVIALSFNTLTLPSADVREMLIQAGFQLPRNDLFCHLSHEVEHAVVRDVIFAFNSQEESVI